MKKKNLFLKFPSREIQKVLYENPTFFLGKLYQKYFLLYTLTTLAILNTEFGLIWTTPWPDAKELFLKFSKTRNSRNSQNSEWKPNFVISTLFHFFCFTLSLHRWHSIPRLVWFGQLLNPMKKTIFKIPFSRNSKSSLWKPTFFLSKLNQKYFLPYTLIKWWYSIPRLVWVGQLLNPMKKKPIFKTPFLRNSKSSVWKPTFFLSKLNKKFFLHNTVITLVKLHTAFGLIWTTPWPDAKELFLKLSKIRNSRNSQNSVWKPNFFLSTLFHFFALHSHYTGDTTYSVWFDLDNSLTRWKKTYF